MCVLLVANVRELELYVSGADILASLEVATAVYQSAMSGNIPVSLPLRDRVNRYVFQANDGLHLNLESMILFARRLESMTAKCRIYAAMLCMTARQASLSSTIPLAWW